MREEIEEIIKDKFWVDGFNHCWLCYVFKRTTYQDSFQEFWKEINTERITVMSWYFPDKSHYL